MLVIESTRRLLAEARRLPALSRLGLLLMLGAGVLDVVVHLAAGDAAGHGSPVAHAAHVLGIAGMVLVLSGVVVDGARHHARQPAAKHGGLDPDALR
ncbi:MAG TPA: hypothetical protein VFK38_02840 [Candidatus Limnocylindrales bacterium]|nr:hypothetical protein [Candidatus Limnocylindrales bacterium]